MKRITPADLVNAATRSGYSHVGYNVTPAYPAVKPYQAYDSRRIGPTRKHRWKGPRRATALEAALDYCLYVNDGHSPHVTQNKSAGHERPQQPKRRVPSDIAAARGMIRDWEAQQRKGAQGYVYCISDGTAVKIGYSVNPQKRVLELQTGNPRVLTLVATLKGSESKERALHRKHAADNILQEWFHPTDAVLSSFGIKKGATA